MTAILSSERPGSRPKLPATAASAGNCDGDRCCTMAVRIVRGPIRRYLPPVQTEAAANRHYVERSDPGADARAQLVRGRVEAARAAPEGPRRAGPQRGVAAGVVEVPGGAAAGRPHRVLERLLKLGVVGVLDLLAHVDRRQCAPVDRPQRAEHVL